MIIARLKKVLYSGSNEHNFDCKLLYNDNIGNFSFTVNMIILHDYTGAICNSNFMEFNVPDLSNESFLTFNAKINSMHHLPFIDNFDEWDTKYGILNSNDIIHNKNIKRLIKINKINNIIKEK